MYNDFLWEQKPWRQSKGDAETISKRKMDRYERNRDERREDILNIIQTSFDIPDAKIRVLGDSFDFKLEVEWDRKIATSNYFSWSSVEESSGRKVLEVFETLINCLGLKI